MEIVIGSCMSAWLHGQAIWFLNCSIAVQRENIYRCDSVRCLVFDMNLNLLVSGGCAGCFAFAPTFCYIAVELSRMMLILSVGLAISRVFNSRMVLLALVVLCRLMAFGSSKPTGRCSSLWQSEAPDRTLQSSAGSGLIEMAAQQQGNGFQWVSLSSSDSGHEQNESETEPCEEALPMELDEVQSGSVPCGGRFPANTPITPPVVGLSHRQFHDEVMGQLLPGDGHGRECFDTFPTFVVGDPSARFDTHTPLTYETTGEIGRPIWKDIFRHILKECSYLSAFDLTLSMSWWTRVTSGRMELHKMDYHTGQRLWHGGIVGSACWTTERED